MHFFILSGYHLNGNVKLPESGDGTRSLLDADLSRESTYLKALEKEAGVTLAPRVRQAYLDSETSDSYVKDKARLDFKSMPLLTDNPFIFPTVFNERNDFVTREQALKYQKQYDEKISRIKKLFYEARTAVTVLLETKKNGENNKDIDNMITRVNSVEPKFTDFSKKEQIDETCILPNAFFNVRTNQVTICPQFFLASDHDLNSVLYHELAHSIGPCVISVNPDIIGDISSNPQVQSIPADLNPFKMAIECLASNKSVGAKYDSFQVSLSAMDKELDHLKSSGMTPENSSKYREIQKYKAELLKESDTKACNGDNQMDEAWSDWISAETSGLGLRQMGRKEAKAAAIESQGFFLSMICSDIDSPIKNKVHELWDSEQCKSVKTSKEEKYNVPEWLLNGLKDPHPKTTDRTTKIFFTNPDFKKALGCSSEEIQYCE